MNSLLSCLVWSAVTAGAQFVPLGKPVAEMGLAFHYLSDGPDGHPLVWAAIRGEESQGAVGIDTVTGRVHTVDLQRYRASNIRITQGPDGSIYLFAGQPGRFFRYQPVSGELTELGTPSPAASYWVATATSPEGIFYVGTYPRAELVACDMRTQTVRTIAALNDDDREMYILSVAVDPTDGLVYAGVGLHHQELWVVNPADGAKRQLLPPDLAAAQGAPTVWTAADGGVYGRSGQTTFRCLPDRLEAGPAPRAVPGPRAVLPSGELAIGMAPDGRLQLRPPPGTEAAPREVPTDYRGLPLKIFSLGPIVDGQLYGSGLKPGHLFTWDIARGEGVDHGTVTSGAIQIYDIVEHATGLYLGSYTGASLDRLDPAQPIVRGTNPQRIVQLSREFDQERPEQVIVGPDDAIWVGTVPIKGRLGGALARIDPADLSVQCWRDLVPDQSLISLVGLPDSQELLVGSTIRGGTSAKIVATEAVLARWDIATARVVAEYRPVPGARQYMALARARHGLVHGLAGTAEGLSRFVFDPARGETVLSEALPLQRGHYPFLHDQPVGPRGLLLGFADDALFAIDPADNSFSILARHDSLAPAQGLWVTDTGIVYYGSRATLWRCDLGW